MSACLNVNSVRSLTNNASSVLPVWKSVQCCSVTPDSMPLNLFGIERLRLRDNGHVAVPVLDSAGERPTPAAPLLRSLNAQIMTGISKAVALERAFSWSLIGPDFAA